MDLKYRLSESTVIEPLVNGWHAWSYLISPIPASLQTAYHQIPTLRSYLEDPEGHARLARDPQFAGGPFCDLSPDRADSVAALLEKTERELGANIELANDVISFQNFLQREAKGQCLETFYPAVPERLRGLVELVYDYYDHPIVRFIEGLLYESSYYNEELQSLRIFGLSRDNERPFFLSTPRFVEEQEIEWRVPFNSASVSELLKLDLYPQPLSAIAQLLSLDEADEHKLLPRLAPDAVTLPEKWGGKIVRMRYFGHACVLIERNGISIMTDPCISARPECGGVDRYSFHDLPEKIDFALITHDHQDHFSLETLLRLRGRIECLVVPKSAGLLYGDISLKLMAKKMGFKHVIDLEPLESISLPDGEIIGIPFLGEHGDLAQSKTAYLIRAGLESILFAADSDCLEKKIYENVRRIVGQVETIFLGTECVGAPLTWRNGPLFPKRPSPDQDETRRYHGCNSERALHIGEVLGAKRIYNYAMGKEPWLEHLLGLGLSEDSPQIRESRALLRQGASRGLIACESPFGKSEIYLDHGRKASVTSAVMFQTTDEVDEDQFVF